MLSELHLEETIFQEAGPSGPANDVVDAGDGEGLYHDGDFEEDFDKIMRGD
ncbi:helix-turn-helix transcriptional regulator [Sesbania bispinosa]|nr:helix-turn-helix transcriptional regulator [Sesbania bispinosa]